MNMPHTLYFPILGIILWLPLLVGVTSSSTGLTKCHVAHTLSNFALIQSSELQEVVQQLHSAIHALVSAY